MLARPGTTLPTSTIWLVCAWSAVTITSVSWCVLANSRATWTALSKATVSPICWHGAAAWSCLSMDAPSTCRKKPFLRSCFVSVRSLIACFSISASDG